MADHKVKFVGADESDKDVMNVVESNWWIDGDVVVYFTGEGTSHCSIIDGYEYVGEYCSKDGMCYSEKCGGDMYNGSLDGLGYLPTKSNGTQLKKFQWFE